MQKRFLGSEKIISKNWLNKCVLIEDVWEEATWFL